MSDTWHSDSYESPPWSDCYYRIQIRDENTWNVCCLQSWDENDYDKTLWLRHHGSLVWFRTEEDAESWVREHGPEPRVNREMSKML